jgi:hypothetical protein
MYFKKEDIEGMFNGSRQENNLLLIYNELLNNFSLLKDEQDLLHLRPSS